MNDRDYTSIDFVEMETEDDGIAEYNDDLETDLKATLPLKNFYNGTITISNVQTGNHRTFRIRTQPKDANFAPGVRVIGLLVGSDNEHNYKNFGFVVPDNKGRDHIKLWRKYRTDGQEWTRFADILHCLVQGKESELSVSGKEGYQAVYIVQFEEKCIKCNRTLTDPKSIRLQIGPICRGKE